jgi:hypothetical protein
VADVASTGPPTAPPNRPLRHDHDDPTGTSPATAVVGRSRRSGPVSASPSRMRPYVPFGRPEAVGEGTVGAPRVPGDRAFATGRTVGPRPIDRRLQRPPVAGSVPSPSVATGAGVVDGLPWRPAFGVAVLGCATRTSSSATGGSPPWEPRAVGVDSGPAVVPPSRGGRCRQVCERSSRSNRRSTRAAATSKVARAVASRTMRPGRTEWVPGSVSRSRRPYRPIS